MNEQIGALLIEIIKQGGILALWGIGIWLVIGLLRVTTICLAIYLVVKVVCQAITTNYKVHKEQQAMRVHLLSEECSRKVSQALDSFSKESLTVVNELKLQLIELKKHFKKN